MWFIVINCLLTAVLYFIHEVPTSINKKFSNHLYILSAVVWFNKSQYWPLNEFISVLTDAWQNCIELQFWFVVNYSQSRENTTLFVAILLHFKILGFCTLNKWRRNDIAKLSSVRTTMEPQTAACISFCENHICCFIAIEQLQLMICIHIYRLPVAGEYRIRWIERIMMHQKFDSIRHSKFLICDVHFDQRCLRMKDDRVALKKGTIPTVFPRRPVYVFANWFVSVRVSNSFLFY